MEKPLPRRFMIPLLFLALLPPLGALDAAPGKIEDDSSLRISLDSWFIEAPARVLGRPPFIHTLPGGGRIQVRTQAGQNEFAVILAREQNGGFPYWARGSWMLTRRRDDGQPLRIQFFPRSDPAVYVQFRPQDETRCLMDVVLYDSYLVRSKTIPLPLERLFHIPVEEALRLAGDSLPRRYFEPRLGDYRDLRLFVSQVRQRLPEIEFRDDGAMDETGRYVFINTPQVPQEGRGGLNCSGFAKWLVDGILRPLTGEFLAVEPLKAASGGRGSSFTAPYEALRDPFFGLDWTRNLAARANAVLRSPEYETLREIEVQKAPFAQVIAGRALQSYPGFLLNAGFGFEGLHALLYTLAIDEPGYIYLGSINNELDPSPRMRQHFHVAALVPYFTEAGVFQVAVFESAEETSFAQFKTRYPGHCINLVRVPVEGLFDPPQGR
jgi:hypothetical protein